MEIQELATAYGAAWASHDPDAIVAMHTPDTVFCIHADGGESAEGRDAVREMIAGQLAQSPDLAFAPTRFHLGTDHYVVEYEMSGSADGKSFACQGVDVFSVSDGLIARKDTYLDGLSYVQQVGSAS